MTKQSCSEKSGKPTRTKKDKSPSKFNRNSSPKLTLFTASPNTVEKSNQNGPNKLPYRVFTYGTPTGEALALFLTQRNDQLQAWIYDHVKTLEKVPTQMEKLSITGFFSRRSKDSPDDPMPDGRQAKYANANYHFMYATYCHPNIEDNTQEWRVKWGKTLAQAFNILSSKSKWPVPYAFKGDCTPTPANVLGEYLTTNGVLNIITATFNENNNMMDVIMDDQTMKMYFSEEYQIRNARECYRELCKTPEEIEQEKFAMLAKLTVLHDDDSQKL